MNNLTYSADDIYWCDYNKRILCVENLSICGVYWGSFKRNIENDQFFTQLTSKMDIPLRVKTDAEVIKEIQDIVQDILDEKAHEKNYDNGFALASYSDSTNETFREEAARFIEWRDQCWLLCYDLLDKYQKGEIYRPEPEDLYDLIPVFNW